jgi:hypothetical protein
MPDAVFSWPYHPGMDSGYSAWDGKEMVDYVVHGRPTSKHAATCSTTSKFLRRQRRHGHLDGVSPAMFEADNSKSSD